MDNYGNQLCYANAASLFWPVDWLKFDVPDALIEQAEKRNTSDLDLVRLFPHLIPRTVLSPTPKQTGEGVKNDV
jgi:hypothetical protein